MKTKLTAIVVILAMVGGCVAVPTAPQMWQLPTVCTYCPEDVKAKEQAAYDTAAYHNYEAQRNHEVAVAQTNAQNNAVAAGVIGALLGAAVGASARPTYYAPSRVIILRRR